MNILTKAFWEDATERAVKTIAQTALALLTVQGVSLLNFDYKALLAACLLAGVISLLTSIISANLTGTPDGSALN
jgi:hypothetical protein